MPKRAFKRRATGHFHKLIKLNYFIYFCEKIRSSCHYEKCWWGEFFSIFFFDFFFQQHFPRNFFPAQMIVPLLIQHHKTHMSFKFFQILWLFLIKKVKIIFLLSKERFLLSLRFSLPSKALLLCHHKYTKEKPVKTKKVVKIFCPIKNQDKRNIENELSRHKDVQIFIFIFFTWFFLYVFFWSADGHHQSSFTLFITLKNPYNLPFERHILWHNFIDFKNRWVQLFFFFYMMSATFFGESIKKLKKFP